MKVVDVERIIVDVPFTKRQQKIAAREVYNWAVSSCAGSKLIQGTLVGGNGHSLYLGSGYRCGSRTRYGPKSGRTHERRQPWGRASDGSL